MFSAGALVEVQCNAHSQFNYTCSLLISTNLSCIDQLRMVFVSNMGNHTLLLQMTNCLTSDRAIDFETFTDNRRRDELCLWNLFHHLVIRGLVKHHQVGKLFLDLAFAPLFLPGASASHGRFQLCLL